MSDNANPDLSKGEDAGGDEGDKDAGQTLEQLKAERDAARADAAKYRKLSKDVIAERDQLKKTKPKEDDGENYKELYQKVTEDHSKLKDTLKTRDINSSVKEQLLKVGVLPEAVEAATKLIDFKLIDYSEETGVDKFGVETAVKDLKSKMKFMFGSKVETTEIRKAGSGNSADPKEMKRADFDKIPLWDRAKVAKEYKIVD